jgi:hypothetical protein
VIWLIIGLVIAVVLVVHVLGICILAARADRSLEEERAMGKFGPRNYG